jgi:hypothetical protein
MVVAVNIGVVDWDVLISATEAIVNLRFLNSDLSAL